MFEYRQFVNFRVKSKSSRLTDLIFHMVIEILYLSISRECE